MDRALPLEYRERAEDFGEHRVGAPGVNTYLVRVANSAIHTRYPNLPRGCSVRSLAREGICGWSGPCAMTSLTVSPASAKRLLL